MNDMSNNISVNSLDKEATLIYKLIDTLILDMVEQPIKKHATTTVKQTRGDDSRGTYGYTGNHKLYIMQNKNAK
tara:strand:+ start:439 stop:660 length:222 start_codon:yes stop_codon:yes gene_type:complete